MEIKVELTDYHKAKIRQTVSNLLGPDTKVFLKTRDLGPGLKEVQIMVESVRVLEDKAVVKAQVRERLSEPMKEFTTKLVLIDPDVTLTEEQKRFKWVAFQV